jgi:hypothetical protein
MISLVNRLRQALATLLASALPASQPWPQPRLVPIRIDNRTPR